MHDPEFVSILKADSKTLDHREVLAAVVAAAAADDDNDNDAAEIQRLVDARNLVLAVNGDRQDARLVKAAGLLQAAINQEKTEDTDG